MNCSATIRETDQRTPLPTDIPKNRPSLLHVHRRRWRKGVDKGLNLGTVLCIAHLSAICPEPAL